jgi:hypothetical protein
MSSAFLSLLSAAGLGAGSGVNAYASLLVLGLVSRLLPGVLESDASRLLGSTPALVTLGVLYTIEFFADKFPAVDHVWDAIHTFIRPVAGGFAAYVTVSDDASPALLIGATALAGGVALTSHLGKASVRAVSTATTGGLLNPVLSITEDIVAVTGVLIALFLPLAVLAFLGLLAIGVVVFLRRRRAPIRAQ